MRSWDIFCRFTSEGQDANPSHDNQGNELKGSDLKKGKSAADKARKLRVYYDTQIREKGPNFLETLEEDIRNAEKAVEQEIRDAESAARQETKKVKKEQSGKCNGSYWPSNEIALFEWPGELEQIASCPKI